MPRPIAEEYARCYRFVVQAICGPALCEGPEHRVGAFQITWDGPNLIVSRGLRVNPEQPCLFDMVKTWDGLIVELWGSENSIVRRWKCTYERILNRGFLFMDATSTDIALEAVCLVNASMVELPQKT